MITGILTGLAIGLLVIAILQWTFVLGYYILKGILTVVINIAWKIIDGILQVFWWMCDEVEDLIEKGKKRIFSLSESF